MIKCRILYMEENGQNEPYVCLRKWIDTGSKWTDYVLEYGIKGNINFHDYDAPKTRIRKVLDCLSDGKAIRAAIYEYDAFRAQFREPEE